MLVSWAEEKLVTERQGSPRARHTVVTTPEKTQHWPYLAQIRVRLCLKGKQRCIGTGTVT